MFLLYHPKDNEKIGINRCEDWILYRPQKKEKKQIGAKWAMGLKNTKAWLCSNEKPSIKDNKKIFRATWQWGWYLKKLLLHNDEETMPSVLFLESGEENTNVYKLECRNRQGDGICCLCLNVVKALLLMPPHFFPFACTFYITLVPCLYPYISALL